MSVRRSLSFADDEKELLKYFDENGKSDIAKEAMRYYKDNKEKPISDEMKLEIIKILQNFGINTANFPKNTRDLAKKVQSLVK
jgi:hypothetical protein